MFANNNLDFNLPLNFVLGFVIGYLIYIMVLNPTVFKGPNSKDIINLVYNINGKQYILDPVVCGTIYT